MENKSKTVVINTIMLYIRMMFVMAIALYTSRVVLHVLGFVDYGIYYVVAGLASSFTFFSSSLSNATQRFLNYNIGTDNTIELRRIFGVSLLIYLALAFVAFMFAEIIGLWLITNKLNIPSDRITAAICILNATIFSFVVTLISTVYESVLISRENMKVYAYIGIIEGISKLLIVYMLYITPFDRLISYALLLFTVHLLVKAIPVVVCLRQYAESRSFVYWDETLFRKMFIFMGWNGIGTAVWAINEQGINILLNLFFGPVVNAARGVASQAGQAINNFGSQFLVATRPQIIKSYASGNIPYFKSLLYGSTKFSYYLLWLLCSPFIFFSNFILGLWLKDVPEFADEFFIWILVYSLVNILTQPSWSAIQAIGNLKKYILIGGIVYLSAFPISYFSLKMGCSPLFPLKILTFVRLLYVFVVVHITSQYIDFTLTEYIKKSIIPITKVTLTSFLALYIIFTVSLPKYDIIHLLTFGIISIMVNCIMIWLVGIDENEKELVISYVKKLKKNGKN